MYGQKLLGVDYKLSLEFKESIFEGNEILRIGFTRVSFNYVMKDEEIDYVMDAIEFIARYGWMLLPQYQFDLDMGTWINRDEKETKVRSWLGAIDYSSGSMVYPTSANNAKTCLQFYKDNSKNEPLSYYIKVAED
jgi:hypothetical protein